ncbi:MAG: YraN family protein [Bacteroidaceae bacterium]|jgi:putative endonuclease|nr:YraN family protein [Bacteroidaceae bacterium]
MAKHNDLGQKGEDMAAQYLEQHGYCILERNWTNMGRKELDIVATKDDVAVFVEVKTRRAGSAQGPLEAVDARKQRRICLAADSFLKANRIDFRSRFDIVAIIYNDEGSRIEHIEDAFRARPKFY